MATIYKWTPFDVALDITATSGTVTRTSATKFTVKINASWETFYDGAQTNYGMTASSGGGSVTLNPFGTKASSGSGSFTGTYTISGNGSATKTITVTFRNFNNDNGNSATKSVSFNVTVPAWTSYKVTYNANGGSGAPGTQTKWKDQTLTLSGTRPTRTGYSFLGWSTSSTATSATYSAGGSYTANAAATLYAVWKANTYTVKYNANGGSGAPGNQTKTYGKALTLSSTKPTRTNYTFKGWSTSASATTATYQSGGSYTANAAATLYAVWELSYEKPTISNLSAVRCDSSGTFVEDGTCALVKFTWSTYQTATSITIKYYDASGTNIGTTTVTASGTSGTVSKVISNYAFDTELSYSFTVSVKDKETTERTTSMSGLIFNIDFCQDKATAIGKPAEQLYDEKGRAIRVFDVNWRAKFRDHIALGEKIGHTDGREGVFISKEGYIQLQRTTAQSYHPYIAFFLDAETAADGTIRLNCTTKEMEFLSAMGYLFANHIKFSSNNKNIYGVDQNGASKICFTPQNANGNTIIGYGNYTANSGNTNIYGKDVMFGISNVASGSATYYPYFRRGNETSLKNVMCFAGFITSSGTELYFSVPFAKPIVGEPTVTVTSVDGFKLRQNDKYTHGSSATEWVLPTSYTATIVPNHGIGIKATFSNTANCINNAPIGIQWSGTISFT